MPIKKINRSDVELQVPAIERFTLGHTPSPGAVLAGIDKPGIRTCGHITYTGSDPSEVPTDDLVAMLRDVQNVGETLETTYRNRVRGKLTAVRAFCVLCASGAKAARACSSVDCALWPFRMGNNPFRRKK